MGNQNVCGPAISNQVEVHLADQHNVPVIPLRCMNATGWKCEQKLCIFCQSSWFLWAFEENKNYTCLSGVESIWFEENDIISQQTGKILTYNCWKNLGRILLTRPQRKGTCYASKSFVIFFCCCCWALSWAYPGLWWPHVTGFQGSHPASGNKQIIAQ